MILGIYSTPVTPISCGRGYPSKQFACWQICGRLSGQPIKCGHGRSVVLRQFSLPARRGSTLILPKFSRWITKPPISRQSHLNVSKTRVYATGRNHCCRAALDPEPSLIGGIGFGRVCAPLQTFTAARSNSRVGWKCVIPDLPAW